MNIVTSLVELPVFLILYLRKEKHFERKGDGFVVVLIVHQEFDLRELANHRIGFGLHQHGHNAPRQAWIAHHGLIRSELIQAIVQTRKVFFIPKELLKPLHQQILDFTTEWPNFRLHQIKQEPQAGGG